MNKQNDRGNGPSDGPDDDGDDADRDELEAYRQYASAAVTGYIASFTGDQKAPTPEDVASYSSRVALAMLEVEADLGEDE